jgi:chromosome segregation ATPase
MPQQAILDLPVIEFEPFVRAPARLHALCIDRYGLSGIAPHPDIAFHFAASLWRYRQAESPKQLAGLASAYVQALAAQLAARRRVSASRAGTGSVGGLDRAEGALRAATRHLEQVTRHVLDFAADLLDAAARHPERADRRVDENLNAMGEPAWVRELEQACAAFQHFTPEIDWDAELAYVLEQFEDAEAPTPGSAHRRGLMDTLRDELADARHKATERVRNADAESRELARFLQQTTRKQPRQPRDTEHRRLQAELAAVREQLERLGGLQSEVTAQPEPPRAPDPAMTAEIDKLRTDVRQLGAEVDSLRAERDQLSQELARTMDASTDSESEYESLLAELEAANSSRLAAADTIDALRERMQSLQDDAEKSALMTGSLEQQLEEARKEVEAHRARIAGADSARAELEQMLTESEARLADADSRNEEAQQQLESRQAQLDQARGELKAAREKLARTGKDLETAAAGLKQTEAYAAEQRKRASALEAENAEFQKKVADSRTRMVEFRDNLEEARASERALREEIVRVESERENALEQLRTERETLAAVEQALSDLQEAREKLATEVQALQAAADANNGRMSEEQAELVAQLDSLKDELTAERRWAVDLERQTAEAEATREAEAARAESIRKTMDEKLALAHKRLEAVEHDNIELSDALKHAEEARQALNKELDSVTGRQSGERKRTDKLIKESKSEVENLQKQLAEAESNSAKRQRELERVRNEHRGVLEDVAAVADLRTEYERASNDAERQDIASRISRRLDSLFSVAGRPIHADRRTEKIVILHVRKSPEDSDDAVASPLPIEPERNTSSEDELK